MKGVFCYRNLNRPGVVWSVKSRKSGLVVARKGVVVLKNVSLKVSQAGRKRVLEQRRKNVHAGAQGTWFRDWETWWMVSHTWIKIAYNPYKNETFVRLDTGESVTHAKYVKLNENGAWAVFD